MWILKTHKTQAIREMSLFTTTDVQFVKQTESRKCLNSSNKKTYPYIRIYVLWHQEEAWILTFTY